MLPCKIMVNNTFQHAQYAQSTSQQANRTYLMLIALDI
jgi:hypothetical protein